MSFKPASSGNKEIIRKYIEQVVNTGNTGLIPNFISPKYREIFNNESFGLGIEGAVDHIRGIRQTYPDLNLTIDRQIAEGDYVVTCYTMRGTHLGEWMGIKPTGKRIEVSGINVDRIENGMIVEHGGAANLLHPLLEIGAVVINHGP